jgi:hypothetical protein
MSQLIDNIQLGVEVKTYKWHLYQLENWNTESDVPCAVFFHKEDAMCAFDHLKDHYKSLRFVLTNIKDGESYVA